MIEQCAWCKRLRVRREPNPVVEGEPTLGPTEGVAWLPPADPAQIEGPLQVSHGICPRCARQMELQSEAAGAFPADKPDLGAWAGHGATGLSDASDKPDRETHRIGDPPANPCPTGGQNEEADDG